MQMIFETCKIQRSKVLKSVLFYDIRSSNFRVEIQRRGAVVTWLTSLTSYQWIPSMGELETDRPSNTPCVPLSKNLNPHCSGLELVGFRNGFVCTLQYPYLELLISQSI